MMKISKVLGVTLLEVMLVLAVAAMIILMSVKFYKSATDSSQVNALIEEVQAITAAADGIAQGDTAGYAAVSTTAITNVVGSQNMVVPWGGGITIAASTTSSVTLAWPAAGTSVTTLYTSKLQTNPKYTGVNSTGLVYTSTN